MRNLPPELVTEYTSPSVRPILMAEMFFDSATIGMWTGLGSFDYEGTSYLGGGNFIGVSPIEETQEVQAKGIVVSLNGIPASLISLSLTENLRGRPFRLYLSSARSKSRIALEDETGYILTEGGDYVIIENELASIPYRIFSGLMDVMEYSTDGREASIRLSVESVLIRGQRAKLARYTAEDQKKYYPADKGFDLINQLQDKELVW